MWGKRIDRIEVVTEMQIMFTLTLGFQMVELRMHCKTTHHTK